MVAAIFQDLRYATRTLRKAPAFAIVSIVTLALAIAANTAAFTLVNAWLIRPLPLKNPEQLVSVWRTQRSRPRVPQYFNLYHDYVAWAAENRSFQQLAATFDVNYALTGSGEAEELHGAVVTWNLFELAGVHAERGRLFEQGDVASAPACVITHGLWQRRFSASADIIGRGIELNGKLYRVLGVLPANFSLRVLDRPFDDEVWTLITADDPTYTAASPSPVGVFGRLRTGVSAAQAEADLTAIQLALDQHPYPDHFVDAGILVVNLQQDNVRAIRSSLLLLFAAVAVLLLIACVNVGGLVMGRASERTREFAVRVALGCGAGRLLQQVAIEVLVLFVMGGAAGLAIAEVGLRLFVAANPFGVLPANGIVMDWHVMLAAAATVLLAALVFGSLPAYRATLVARMEGLRAGATSSASAGHLRARAAFVTAEFALSLLLLVAAGLLVATFLRTNSEHVGYATDHTYVASVAVPNREYSDVGKQTRFGNDLLLRLRTKTGVTAAGIGVSWPFQINGLNPIELVNTQGTPSSQLPQAAWLTGSDGYFDALGVPLLRGRAFAASDTADSPRVAVINQQMASRYFAGQDPIGQRLRIRYLDDDADSGPRNPWLTVIGVVGDTRSQRYNGLQWDNYPIVYSAFAQRQQPARRYPGASTSLSIYLRGRASLDRALVASAVAELDPNVPVASFQSAGEILSGLIAQPRVRAGLFAAFGGLALLLAAVGIYGLMAQNVEQRRREIGIRMALGAVAENIVRLIVGRALLLASAGMVAGIAAALALSRVLRGVVYGVSTVNVGIYAAGVVALIAVAALASYLPARRASKLDPAVILRSE